MVDKQSAEDGEGRDEARQAEPVDHASAADVGAVPVASSPADEKDCEALDPEPAIDEDPAMAPSAAEEATADEEVPSSQRSIRAIAHWALRYLPPPVSKWLHRRWRTFSNRMYDQKDRAETLRLMNEEGFFRGGPGPIGPGDLIEIPAIWITELFLPSTADSLSDGVRRLGWHTRRFGKEGILDEIESRRSSGGGWSAFGHVASPDYTHVMSDFVTELPQGVRSAFPRVYYVTPAITALQVMFVYTDEASSDLQEVLALDHEAYLRKQHRRPSKRRWWRFVLRTTRLDRRRTWRGGYSMIDRDAARRLAAEAHMRKRREACSDWVRRHFPGAFDALNVSELPSAQLVLTNPLDPTEPWRNTIFEDLGGNWRRWHTQEWPSARISLPSDIADESMSLTFFCKKEDAFPDDRDGDSGWGIAQQANEMILGLLVRWSLCQLLTRYNKRLSILRDITQRYASRSLIRNMKQVRRLVARDFLDYEVAATETTEYASDDSKFRSYCIKPVEDHAGRPGKPSRPPEEMLSWFERWCAASSTQVRASVSMQLATLSVIGSLGTSISTVRTQRIVLVLSVLSVIVAIVAFRQAG